MISIDGLVHELADLQEQSVNVETEADAASNNIDVIIALKKQELAELEAVRSEIRYPYEVDIAETNNRIGAMQDCIIEAWDGEKKTLQGDGWVLKFRTTKSLEINDGGSLMSDIMKHFGPHIIADEFISGFHKTKVKKFIDLHPQPPDVAKLIEKTTVKLEME